jgi:hypothetical protein
MMTADKTELAISLPTARLLLIPAIGCVLVGACWAGVTILLTGGAHRALGALLAGGAAASAALISMLTIRPWRTRPLIRWPFVFLAGTLVQTVLTLLGGLLLYFASFGESIGTWLCLVVSFWAGLAGLVWVYGSHMKRAAPAGSSAAAAGQAASPPSTE